MERAGGQLARFLAVGASNTVVTLAVYAALIAASVPYLAAGATAFAAGAVNGYLLNSRWTFRDAPERRPLVYFAVQFGAVATNAALLHLLVADAGAAPLAAQALALPPVTLASFALNRMVTFGRGRGHGTAPAGSHG